MMSDEAHDAATQTDQVQRVRRRLRDEIGTPVPLRGETTVLVLMALNTERAGARPYSRINEDVLKTIHERFGRHLDTNPRGGTTEQAIAWSVSQQLIAVDHAHDTWSTTAALEQMTG